jgi:hypothetical protein
LPGTPSISPPPPPPPPPPSSKPQLPPSSLYSSSWELQWFDEFIPLPPSWPVSHLTW